MAGKKKKHAGGRPTVMTPEVIAKLEHAFSIDATVQEAIYYADISADAFYDYLKKEPKFSERIEALRARPVLLARQTVAKRIPESYGNAIDYLKRKRKKEFGDNVDITTGGDKLTIFNDEQIKRAARQVLDDNPSLSE